MLGNDELPRSHLLAKGLRNARRKHEIEWRPQKSESWSTLSSMSAPMHPSAAHCHKGTKNKQTQ